MAHVCDGVLHSGRLAISVTPEGVHHVKHLPAPCTRQPTPLRAIPDELLPATEPPVSRQLDDRAASYVRKGAWYRVDAHGALRTDFVAFEPEAVLHGLALRVVDGQVQTSRVAEPAPGTEGLLTLGAVSYVPDGVAVPLGPQATPPSTWTGPHIIPAKPSALARQLCVPQPRALATEGKQNASGAFVSWVTAFAIVARGCAGRRMSVAATWQMLRSVAQRLGADAARHGDPRVGWLVFLLKQERPDPMSLGLANALRLAKHPSPASSALCYRLAPAVLVDQFIAFVTRLQRAYPFPAAAGVMERFALTTNVDPEGHFLYLPFFGAEQTVVSREEAAPYQGPRDIHVDWRHKTTRKRVLSVVAAAALLHLYRNPAWLRALECAKLRNGVTPAELRGWGSLLQRLVLPPAELLARCRTELHAAHNAAFNLLQTSKEKGNPSAFAVAVDLVQALRNKKWTEEFIAANTRPDSNVPAALAPPDRAWHRCWLQYVPIASANEDWERCEQCDREAASAPYEPAAGAEPPNDTHVYMVLPEYALWCALGRDDAAMALAGVNNRAAAEAAVLQAHLGARVEGELRLFNRADARHPSFL